MSLRTDRPAAGLSPDDIYARLVALGAGRSDLEAQRALAALALVLINHVGDPAVVDEAFRIAEGL